MTTERDYKCPFCGGRVTAGHLVTHVDDTVEPVVMIQNVPAQVCQQCGEQFYDGDVTVRLSRQVDEMRANRLAYVTSITGILDKA